MHKVLHMCFFCFQLQDNSFEFFPMNRALSLQNEEDTNEKKLEQLRMSIEYMVNKMKDEVSKVYKSLDWYRYY